MTLSSTTQLGYDLTDEEHDSEKLRVLTSADDKPRLNANRTSAVKMPAIRMAIRFQRASGRLL